MAPMFLGLATAYESGMHGGDWITIAARAAGTGVLGFALSLMVAIAETLFREAWSDVFFGSESRRFSLSSAPLSIGGGRDCTVYLSDVGPQPVRFTFANSQVLRTPPGATQAVPVPAGHEELFGRARIVVGTRGQVNTSGGPSADAGSADGHRRDAPTTPRWWESQICRGQPGRSPVRGGRDASALRKTARLQRGSTIDIGELPVEID